VRVTLQAGAAAAVGAAVGGRVSLLGFPLDSPGIPLGFLWDSCDARQVQQQQEGQRLMVGQQLLWPALSKRSVPVPAAAGESFDAQ
jgi:hypothetical protein